MDKLVHAEFTELQPQGVQIFKRKNGEDGGFDDRYLHSPKLSYWGWFAWLFLPVKK